MNTQQLVDHYIKPTHKAMGGRYHSKSATILSLATCAIESDLCESVAQIGGGPARGWWQMEPDTDTDIWAHCDDLKCGGRANTYMGIIGALESPLGNAHWLLVPQYACAMARLKFAMDPEPLPHHEDKRGLFRYYKRIYNTQAGASTYAKWCRVWDKYELSEVRL